MIEKAIEKILTLAKIQVFENDDGFYINDSKLHRLKRPDEWKPEPIALNTLTSLVDYILINPDNIQGLNSGDSGFFIHIADFDSVRLLAPIAPKNENERFCYVKATSKKKVFAFDYYHSIEDFIIGLQSDFVVAADGKDDTAAIIELLGKLANEHVKTNTDDGFCQTIQVKTGLTTKSNVKVKNPVVVRPFRTFIEIDQPETLAVLRFRNRKDGDAPEVALFESGGGSWRMEAINRIKDYLTERLPGFKIIA